MQVVFPDPVDLFSHIEVKILTGAFALFLLATLGTSLVNWCFFRRARPMPLLSVVMSWLDLTVDTYFGTWLFRSLDHCGLDELLPFFVAWMSACVLCLVINMGGNIWLMFSERQVFGHLWNEHKV